MSKPRSGHQGAKQRKRKPPAGPRPASSGRRPASVGARIAAFLVDVAILLPLSLGSGYLLGPGVAARVGWVVFAALYTIVGVGRFGQTLGKAALRIRVVGHPDQDTADYTMAVRRWALPFAATILAVPAGIFQLLGLAAFLAIYLPVLSGPLHRGLHDNFAGTIVVADPR